MSLTWICFLSPTQRHNDENKEMVDGDSKPQQSCIITMDDDDCLNFRNKLRL